MFFAELGAEVLKIENKKTDGDVTRQWRIPDEVPDGPSAYYSAINYRKQTMLADLSDPMDRTKVHNEIENADIVISNFSEVVAGKLKVDFPTLREINPQLIFLHLDGFAHSKRLAYDVVLQAETGWISMTGHPEKPAKLPVALIDILAGHQLKEGALLALIHRMRSGKGSLVRCNLEEASLASLANQATNYLMNNKIAQPIGTLHPNIAPYGDWFSTRDEVRIVLAVGSDAQFGKLCGALNLNLHSQPEFSNNKDRIENRAELRERLQSALVFMDLKEVSTKFDAAGIPFGVIRSLDKVLKTPAAKSLMRAEKSEGRETVRLSGNAFKADFLDTE